MVKVHKGTQRVFDAEHEALEKLYALMGVGETHEGISAKRIGETIDVKEGIIAPLSKALDELGVLKRVTTYPAYQQTKVDWTLLVPLHEGKKRLEAWHERKRLSPVPLWSPNETKRKRAYFRKPNGAEQPTTPAPSLMERVAMNPAPATKGAEIVAVAGPESESPFAVLKPLRKDESHALVEAARQYKGKSSFLRAKIAELKAEGFEVDEAVFSFKRDGRLETIALVLPYIESLEAEVSRTAQWVSHAKEQARQLEELSLRHKRLKTTHEQLLASTVGASARA